MYNEKMIKAVLYLCPYCKFEEFESVEQLRKTYGFDGKNLKSLPHFECHGCHEYMIVPYKIVDIPASWVDPF